MISSIIYSNGLYTINLLYHVDDVVIYDDNDDDDDEYDDDDDDL